MIEKLILGTVQFGLPYGIANRTGQVSFGEVVKILACARERGVKMLDTAAAYGESEEVLGRALAEVKGGGDFRIVTKIMPLDIAEADPARFVRESLESSLRRLRRESLYGAMFHREEDMDRAALLESCQAAGLIEHTGISIDSAAVRSIASGFELVQLPLNVLDCRFDRLIAAHGTARFFARSAYLQGLLLTPEVPPHLAAILPYKQRFEALRQAAGLGAKEFYFRYVLSRRDLAGVVFGVDSLAQLEENLTIAARGPFPADLMAAIAACRTPLPERLIRPKLWTG